MKFVPPVVSRWYRFDWQYAVDVIRIPVLPMATLTIAVMPLLLSVKGLIAALGGSIPLALWLLWPASVLFALAFALVYTVCPKFIREYRDFGQYKERHHSHRWIVWEFYNNLESLDGWKSIVRETLLKGLTQEPKQISDQEARAALAKFPEQTQDDSIQVHTPINIKRDIYLPIICDGKQWVLSMQEDDPKLDAKEKELFWILYSQATKERPRWRSLYWTLIFTSTALVVANVVKNIYFAVMHALQ